MPAAQIALSALCMPLLHDPTEDWAPIELDGEERIAAEILSCPGDLNEVSVATFIRLGYIRFDPRANNYMARIPDGGWHLPSEGLRCSLCQDCRADAYQREIHSLTNQVKMLKADVAIQTATVVQVKEENGALKRQLCAFEDALTQVQRANGAGCGRAAKALCLAKRYKSAMEGRMDHPFAAGGMRPLAAPSGASQQSAKPDPGCESKGKGSTQVGSIRECPSEHVATSSAHNAPLSNQMPTECLMDSDGKQGADKSGSAVTRQSPASESRTQGITAVPQSAPTRPSEVAPTELKAVASGQTRPIKPPDDKLERIRIGQGRPSEPPAVVATRDPRVPNSPLTNTRKSRGTDGIRRGFLL